MKKLLFIGIILVLACVEKEVDYYPLFSGSIRIYELQRITFADKDTTRQVLKQKTQVTGKKFHDYWDEVWEVKSQESGSPIATAFIRKTKSEIRLTQTLNDTAGEMKQLALPLTVGKTWTVALSPADSLIGSVLDIERIKVPAGEFDSCYKVEIKAKNADFSRYMWLAPKIGIVKNEIKSVFTEGEQTKTVIEKGVLIQYNTKPSK